MKNIITISLLLFSCSLYSQDNCRAFPEGSEKRKACELSHKALEYAQGSRASQQSFDAAIAVGPKYAWAYYEKSVPYLKRGLLHEGLQILNEAIKLEPLNYLCYRASWYWQYRNYDLCIQDLETYYALPNAYTQYTPGGEKNMKIVLGLAYAKNNNYEKAIKTIENCIRSYTSEHEIGFADYHILGVCYVRNKQYDKAIEAFEKQFEFIDNIAASYYYLGMAYKAKGDTEKVNTQFEKALLMLKDKNRYRVSNDFRVSEVEIKKEMEN